MNAKQPFKETLKESIPTVVIIIGAFIIIELSKKYTTLQISVLVIAVIVVFLFILHFYKERKRKIKEDRILQIIQQKEGANYFIYRSKKKNRNFIEDKILNKLESSIEILVREPPFTDDFEAHLFNANKKEIQGIYPFLLKIRKSKIKTLPINTLLNEAMKEDRSIESLLEEITLFYST